MLGNVNVHPLHRGERSVADWAQKRVVTPVQSFVILQIPARFEAFSAFITFVWHGLYVNSLVSAQTLCCVEFSAAVAAYRRATGLRFTRECIAYAEVEHFDVDICGT